MIANGLNRHIILIGNQLIIKTLLIGLEGVPDYFQKRRLQRLGIFLNLVLNNGLDDELEYLANRHHTQRALTETPDERIVLYDHEVDGVVLLG